jgi:hypothetical protein
MNVFTDTTTVVHAVAKLTCGEVLSLLALWCVIQILLAIVVTWWKLR